MLPFPKLLVLFLSLWIVNFAPLASQSHDIEGLDYQDLTDYIWKKHGLDQEIINGTSYYYKYYRVLSHPYFSQEESHPGMVVLSGKRFNNVRINYNIYEQNLVLDYPGKNNGIYKIILSSILTDEFGLDDYYFKKLVLLERDPTFYQVIEVNGIICYIHWEKQMLATTNNTQYADFFSEPEQEYFLEYDHKLSPIKNKKSFVENFPFIPKREIKKYMRLNKISFRKASPEQIEDLLEFVDLRINAGTGK